MSLLTSTALPTQAAVRCACCSKRDAVSGLTLSDLDLCQVCASEWFGVTSGLVPLDAR